MTNSGKAQSRRDDPDPKLRALARRLGLRYVTADALSIRRRRSGRGWCYLGAGQRIIRSPATVRRLARLAVPPAYRDVLYAKDPAAPFAGGRARRRRPPAVSLPSGLGTGAGNPQGAEFWPASHRCCRVSGAASASISPLPNPRATSQPRRWSSWWTAAPSGRDAKATRVSAARAERPPSEVERHRQRRPDLAGVPLEGRQEDHQEVSRRSPRRLLSGCGGCRGHLFQYRAASGKIV